MFQSLTRAIAQEHELFDWLRTLYPIWSGINGEAIYVSAKLAMAELMLSGCTTSSDHLIPSPTTPSSTTKSARRRRSGMRFHAARGAMSVGESKGGLPPDSMVEGEENILIDMRRVIEQFHDAKRHAMLRIVIAPCSPFTVSQNLMRESAALARSYGVHLHTHLAETPNDVAYSLEKFGLLPGDYARDVGWVGDDVWHAHCVCLNEREISPVRQDRDGRLPLPLVQSAARFGHRADSQDARRQVHVGLGVDGSASNDSGHLLNEARHGDAASARGRQSRRA